MTTYLDSKYSASAMFPMSSAAAEKELADIAKNRSCFLGKLEPPGALAFR
jgi:hypothetical protein